MKDNTTIIVFPKAIYQTWSTKKLPASIQNSIDLMLLLNSEYEYRLFDDRDMLLFIEQNYDSTVVDAFNSLTIGGAKADFWRYLILYKNGGVYLDIDSMIVGSLNELVSDDGCCVISRENNFGLFVQWCLMFTPNHLILKNCIESCVENIANKKYTSVLQLTGPVVYSNAVNKFFDDESVYSKSDAEVNSLKERTGVRFHSFDYKGYAEFEHPKKDELYKNKLHWREEQRLLGGKI